MDEPMISRDAIRAKARSAHARGVGRDGHGFNWGAVGAIEVWQEEWDRCEVARLENQQLEQAA